MLARIRLRSGGLQPLSARAPWPVAGGALPDLAVEWAAAAERVGVRHGWPDGRAGGGSSRECTAGRCILCAWRALRASRRNPSLPHQTFRPNWRRGPWIWSGGIRNCFGTGVRMSRSARRKTCASSSASCANTERETRGVRRRISADASHILPAGHPSRSRGQPIGGKPLRWRRPAARVGRLPSFLPRLRHLP